ncbi:MAG: hypothetical protein JWN41_1830, partial [Thermoleophilia bacterium]|nr:hypothetical protein [Thermoleophilia bacterium]
DVECFFRSINDHIAGAPNLADEAGTVVVLCECALVECADELRVPTEDFREVHAHAGWFVTRPEHVSSPGTTVVDRQRDYWVVAPPAVETGRASTEDIVAGTFDQLLVEGLGRAVTYREAARARNASLDSELRRMQECADRAHESAVRYETALANYERLMRHRIANPLTVVCGIARTLREVDELQDDVRSQLLDSLLDATDALRDVALDPCAVAHIELALDPWPNGASGSVRP